MESFYGEDYFVLETALNDILDKIDLMRKYRKSKGRRDNIEHCKGRIKSEDSMIEKLKRKGLEITTENALTKITDAVGIRIVCNFIDDIYDIVEMIKSIDDLEVVKEKDYVANPKPNGYRSYHMIVNLTVHMPGETRNIPVEIQIRTISQDCWASLEHKLKYKHDVKNVELITRELKRCAEEMASTDLTMQTVRQLIEGEM